MTDCLASNFIADSYSNTRAMSKATIFNQKSAHSKTVIEQIDWDIGSARRRGLG